MGRILTSNVFAIAYTVGDVPQPPILVEAGDASDADATVVLHAQAQAGAAGKAVRIQALDQVSPARWAGVPDAPPPAPVVPDEDAPAEG